MEAEGLLAGKFLLRSRLGLGSFGEVFDALNVQTGQAVAVKIEKKTVKAPQLVHEAKVLKSIHGREGVPSVLWSGSEPERNILVMTLLGRSLLALTHDYTGECLPLKLVLQVGAQMLSRLEMVHSCSWLHRDVKPDNFVLGRPPDHSRVFLIDFGLAKKYKDERTHQHIFYRENKHLTGTARYASLNCHLGLEQSRRDDIESWVYSLLFLLKGSLPWQGKENVRSFANITSIKSEMSPLEVCSGAPREFVQMLTYCRAMKFEETPNYAFLSSLLNDIAATHRLMLSEPFDLQAVRLSPTRRSSTVMNRRSSKLKVKDKARKSVIVLPTSHLVATTAAVNGTEQSDATIEKREYRWPTIDAKTRQKLLTLQKSQLAD